MTNKLCDKLLSEKDQHRDVASIALKTIVSEVNMAALAQSVVDCLSPKLRTGITSPVRIFFITLELESPVTFFEIDIFLG